MANGVRDKIVFKCAKAHFEGWGWYDYKFGQSIEDYNAKNGVMIINDMLKGMLEKHRVALWAHYGKPVITIQLPVSDGWMDDPSVNVVLEHLFADLYQAIKDGDIDYEASHRDGMVSLLRKYADKFERAKVHHSNDLPD